MGRSSLTDREIHFWNLAYILGKFRLTENQMKVMILRHFCGFKLREIANDYDCSHENIGIMERRARQKILESKFFYDNFKI
jgi:transcriptional regulator